MYIDWHLHICMLCMKEFRFHLLNSEYDMKACAFC